MTTIFDRNNYLDKFITDGVAEVDLRVVAPDYEDFEWGVFSEAIIMDPKHIARPDLISHYLLGDSRYWWILMLINNIEDVWNDLQIGSVIKYPIPERLNAFLNWLGTQTYES